MSDELAVAPAAVKAPVLTTVPSPLVPPAPHPDLRAAIVVPARDEAELIADCVHALARQRGVGPHEYELLLVLDACVDQTHERARRAAADHPGLTLHPLTGHGRGAGHARRLGMELASARLHQVGRPCGLVASTDADSVVDPDWLRTQLELVARGARAIGGRIDIKARDLAALAPAAVAKRELSLLLRRRRALATGLARGRQDHGHFSGASLALTAEAYEHVGGLEPLVALEDEALERALTVHGVPIVRPDSVRVLTSGRLVGRAPLGLAHDLRLASGACESWTSESSATSRV